MASGLKKTIETVALRAGYHVIPAWRMHGHAMARHLEYLFETLGVDLVLDVGANQGQYRDFLRDEVGYRGAVVSFEPIPELFQRLVARSGDDAAWEVRNVALGAVPGSLPFNVMNTTEFSSFLTPSQAQTDRYAESNAVARTISVTVETLNRVLPALRAGHGARAVYLKIDTQGYDRQVIEGASEVLGDVVALQTEMSVTQIYEGMTDYRDMLGFLQGLGFSPSGFFPLGQGRLLRMVEFDCCMVNDRCL
jgi:FkbM family methyltransferase